VTDHPDSKTPLNEALLLRQLAEGDFDAFDALFKLYNKRLYYFALSILKSSADAEDVAQEVFVRVWEKRQGIKTGHSFKSYLFTIAYNIIVSNLRKRITDDKFIAKLEKKIRDDIIPENDNLVFEELDNKYRDIIKQLPPQMKRIYTMHRNMRMSYKEIASNLDLSPNTVRNQFSKALKLIREQMKNDSLLILLFISLFI